MKRFYLFLALSAFLINSVFAQQTPLRVFIRAGEKTHGPGEHDHPKFLADWKELLNQRGAKCDGAMSFPTDEQLQNTDVLVMYAAEGGTIAGDERTRFEAFLKRGGGVVVIHDAVCGKEPQWFQTAVGGAWEHGKSKFYEGDLAFYITDREHPITKGVSNFDFDDEMYYDLHLQPEARVLAATYKPDERNNKDGKPAPSVYDIVPQMWTYEKGNYRAFVSIPGHNYKTFTLPHWRAVLLRGIAWAGKREVDSLCSKEELASVTYPEGGPTSPEKAGAKITAAPGFEVSLVASEPLIEKPISHDWDAKGRLWVAETPEYPAGRKTDDGGTQNRPARDRISILEDTNADGVMDKKSVFFEGLELITSFVFHRDGVIVAQAPDIYFIRDTDGDGRGDKKETLFTGFGTRDTHAVISNLRWGMDGWIYATLGYSGGGIKNKDGGDIGGMSSGVIRFSPEGNYMEQVVSKNGNTWGLDFAADGELFFSQANGNHCLHVVMPEHVLNQARIGGATSYKVIEDHQKVFPLRDYDKQAYKQIDNVGGFTAASGATIYTGGAWPTEFDGNYFVSEPTVNLFHRDILKPSGPTFVASKDRDAEFVASPDLWWRPIHARVGPDGAVYILDFYNQAVVHNDTRGPRHGANNAAVRPDRDHHFGRIWRVQSKDAKKNAVPTLAGASGPDLVKALDHPNQWVRMTAQRLLAENGKDDVVEPLNKFATSSAPATARIHALWAATQLGKLDPNTLFAVLGETNNNVMRKNGVKVAVETTQHDLIEQAHMMRIVACLDDADPRMRLCALTALSYFPPDRRLSHKLVDVYPKLNDVWAQSAAIASASKAPGEILEECIASEDPKGLEPLVGSATAAIVSSNHVAYVSELIIRAAVAPESHNNLRQALLEEMNKNLKPETIPPWSPNLQKLLERLLESQSLGVRSAALPLIQRWDKDHVLDEKLRIQAAYLLNNFVDGKAPQSQRLQSTRNLIALRTLHPNILNGILSTFTTNSPTFQKEVVTLLGDAPEAVPGLLENYSKLAPEAQDAVLNQLLKRTESANAVLDALADKKIDLATLGPIAVNRLRTHSDKAISARANKIIDEIRGPQVKEKNEIIEKLSSIVEQPGDIENGKKLFTQNCAVCHRYKGEGKDIAPDLTGMGAHGPRELLVHVVDPNRVVEPNFISFSVETKDGESHDGIIGRESGSSILLRNASGDTEIAKKDVKQKKSTGRSLMPEGFEALGGEGLRDILAYLCADENIYRVIDLRDAFTANSMRGIYISQESVEETLKFKKFGLVKVGNIPFEIANPLSTSSGNNVVVLKGGQGYAKTFPQKVEIKDLNLTTHTLHILGSVAGWGYPWGGKPLENIPAAKITVTYDNNQKDEFVLTNGVEIADYNGTQAVPGSKEAPGLLAHGQVRWFSRPVKEFFKVKTITLESFDNAVAPTFVAITAETAPRKRIVNTIEDLATFYPKSFGPVRVWMLGGGSSHDFDKYFREMDSVTLAYASDSPIEYRNRLDAFLEGVNTNKADVLYMCSNMPMTNSELKTAIFNFANQGGGFLLVHPALWYNWKDWPEYNQQLVAGGARSHDKYGPVEVTINDRKHPIMENIPRSFTVTDELYHFEPDPKGPPIQVLATGKNPATGVTYPVVWIVKHPKAKIVCITLGHDQGAHDNLAYKVMLQNCMAWVAGKK